ncbi:hypothetical protein AQUCO_11000039v1 [Aquilegia coerulea]|uniref:NB-ARC domain-containing protein n=1 Tax=Aquilegia coerulea TaxID=218851 RepID=A0A2G5C2X6_AQUCA|nr:hypothetical protein AQUCO_11000039v1 [Aquilegia coerulea]
MVLEFLGLAGRRSNESRSVAQKQRVIFPKLTRLIISDMQGWEEWIIPFHQDRMLMPSLRDLSLYACPRLRTLPDVTKFTSLKFLRLSYLDSLVECREETIPNKKYEEEDLKYVLRRLQIEDCPKLSIVPQYMSSPLLEELILKGDVGVLSTNESSAKSVTVENSLTIMPWSWPLIQR